MGKMYVWNEKAINLGIAMLVLQERNGSYVKPMQVGLVKKEQLEQDD